MAYKALRAARGGVTGPRDAARMMQKMGMKVNEIEGTKEVVITTNDKRIVIEDPNVSVVTLQGQQVYQVTGGKQREESLVKQVEISEEDVRLVSEQTGVSLENAKNALKAAEGDLAKAIIELKKGT